MGLVIYKGSDIEELQDLAKAIDNGYSDTADPDDYNPSESFCEQVQELWDQAEADIALGLVMEASTIQGLSRCYKVLCGNGHGISPRELGSLFPTMIYFKSTTSISAEC